MQIQKINLMSFISKQKAPENKQAQSSQITGYSYNPVAYQDYNISFTARLFRSPENFYAQDFNQNGMPSTMKNYLNSSEDNRDVGDIKRNTRRNKMMEAPAMIMSEAYDDLKNIDEIEDAKILFPNEPLFENLVSKPNRKSREGILAEIDLMKDEDNISLFKSGKDDLGVYIIKKIYLEGKSLKEINADFNKDRSNAYKGLSPIEYSTTKAYGIKFPERGFWRSFTATRPEFPYEYKERKTAEGTERSGSNRTNQPDLPKEPRKPRVIMKDHEVRNFVNDLMKNDDIEGMKKVIRKRREKAQGEELESLNMIAEYFGPIQVITNNKIDLSYKMKDYNFELKNEIMEFDPEDESEEKIPFLKKFWDNNPQVKIDRRAAMSETIKEFQEAYGTDIYGNEGKNPEFLALLDYADEIVAERGYYKDLLKSEQKEFKENHKILQNELEEAFADFVDKSESIKHSQDVQSLKNIENFDELLEKAKETVKENVDVHTFRTKNGEVIKIVANLQESYNEIVKQDLCLMPSSFVSTYLNYAKSTGLLTDSYILSLYLEGDEKEKLQDQLLSDEEATFISQTIDQGFYDKYSKLGKAGSEALIEHLIVKYDDSFVKLFNKPILEIKEMLNMTSLNEINAQNREIIIKLIKKEYPQLGGTVINGIVSHLENKEEVDLSMLHSINLPGLLIALGIAGIDSLEQKDKIKIYNKYDSYVHFKDQNLMTTKEKKQLIEELTNYISNYKSDDSSDKKSVLNFIFSVLNANFNEEGNPSKQMFRNTLQDMRFIKKYGATARYILDADASKSHKEARIKKFINDFFVKDVEQMFFINMLENCSTDTIENYVRLYNERMAAGLLIRRLRNDFRDLI